MAPPVGYAPTWEKLEESLEGQSLEASIQGLIALLRRKQVRGDACANATARILGEVVAKSPWHDVDQLLANVQRAGTRLVQAAPQELVIGNIVRRVLGLIRDEATEDRNEEGSEAASEAPGIPAAHDGAAVSRRWTGPAPEFVRPPILPTSASFSSKSILKLFLGTDAASTGTHSPETGASTPISYAQATSAKALKSEVKDGIEEIIDEISQADDQIATFADIHIHPGDYVLVYQPTRTVEKFLTRAAAKKHFTVFLPSSKPSRSATDVPYATLRKKLANAGIKTINIASSSTTAYMPKVNKVILGAKAVVSDGGVLIEGGAGGVARAAHQHSKTVIVLGGVFKLCPEDPVDSTAWTEIGDPSSYVNYADGSMLDVYVENVVTEFVPQNLVDVYVTNLGTHTQNHLASVMADHYKPEDIDFHLY